jgi:hypothetical protein
MAISTYDELQQAVSNWLARSDLTSYVPDMISLAEATFNRELRVREMETSLDVTIDAQTEALPSDFLSARRFYLDTTPTIYLKYLTPEQLYSKWASSTSGTPEVYSIEGSDFVFGPTPSGTSTGKLLYYAKIPALTVSNTTNWLLTAHPDLYLYETLAASAPFLREDPRLMMWKSLAADAMRQVKTSDKRNKASGSTLVVRTEYTE